jgi:hypothetical protein
VAKHSRELIEGLEDQWRDALCSRDMDRLRALVHADFVLIGSRASGAFMMGREEWLEAIQRRDVDAIELEVRDATELENVMVGTVLARWRVKYLGRIIEDCVLLTDVWVHDEGRWQAIRRHSTPAPAGECAKGS